MKNLIGQIIAIVGFGFVCWMLYNIPLKNLIVTVILFIGGMVSAIIMLEMIKNRK